MTNSENQRASAADWVTLLRPRQWLKNGFVLAPLLFGGRASDGDAVLGALLAVATFSMLASAIYALNDVYDRDSDRAHPRKRQRPVASGRIPPGAATAFGVVLAGAAIAAAWMLAPRFGQLALVYVALNVVYTLVLKRVVILDVFTIAAFFLLRLLSGAAVVEVQPSIWILLCGGLLALYLGFTKRRSELAALGDRVADHRAVLTEYDRAFLDQMSGVLLSVTVVAYIMYTLTSETATALAGDQLSYSVVFVLYGVFRYLFLAQRDEGGDPAETLLTDKPLLINGVIWVVYCGWVLYAG